MKRLIIAGAGGQGRECYNWTLDSIGINCEYSFHGFIDDNLKALDGFNSSAKIIGSISEYIPNSSDVFVIAVGSPQEKEKIANHLSSKQAVFVNIIHRSAVIVPTAKLGHGLIISPNVVISDCAKISNHVSINIGSTIGHDVEIGDFSTISSNCDLTGNVQVEGKVFIGSNVSIIPGVRIGHESYLCAGSTIMNNVKPYSKMLGIPAKNFKIK